jgi:flagellum-specific ATP synthase
VTLTEALEDRMSEAVRRAAPQRRGRVEAVVGLTLRVAGLSAAVGDVVHVQRAHDGDRAQDRAGVGAGQPGALPAEVVGVDAGQLVCMPLGEVTGIAAGSPVVAEGRPMLVPTGQVLLGRVLDGLGRPMDGGPPLRDVTWVPLESEPPHPLTRRRVDTQLSLGVRALDTLVPCGRGQRLGIFAGSGVGKSTLLSMLTRGTEAPVRVVGLIGERGREVREFLEDDLGPQGLARSVVVIATSDAPPVVRLRAAFLTTRIAEAFRDAGQDVLLLMDSLTRVAMAQREVGLSAGEPPATRGYPPSVFAMLPRLLERAGSSDRGSVTGLYTVLVDGDDLMDPIADTARSILDGHVVLDRRLATAGHYPAIDVLGSVSRVTAAVTDPGQREAANELRRLLAALREARDLIEIGAYVPGTSPDVDRGRELGARLDAFLRQDIHDLPDARASWAALGELVGHAGLGRRP